MRAIKFNLRLLVVTVGLALAGGVLANAPAAHAAGNYGPDTCLEGWVWRDAFWNDHVCVTPATRAQAAYDNSQATARRNPYGGPYGPDTCLSGWVWREAVPTDHVCVTPATRSQAAYDNSQNANRRASLRIWFSHWTVPPRCSGHICTSTSTDSLPRFWVGGDHFNYGKVYVGVFRLNGGVLASTSLTAGAYGGYVGGSWGFKAPVFDCAALGSHARSNAYLAAYDYMSQRWSQKIYVTTGCAVL